MKIEKELRDDLEIAYNAIMSQVYRRYSHIPSYEIRMAFMQFVVDHVTTKITKSLQKKNNPTRSINKLTKLLELQQLKVNKIPTEIPTEVAMDKDVVEMFKDL
jgi:hypothetical protein